MPPNISQDCQNLIARLLTKDSKERPSIFDVLRMPIIYNQILQFTEGFTLGIRLSAIIKHQMLGLEIAGPLEESKEEEKEEALPHQAAVSINSLDLLHNPPVINPSNLFK